MTAEELKARHIAFPAISTGVYKYPYEQAAEVAFYSIKFTIEMKEACQFVKRITLVLYNDEIYKAFQSALFKIFPEDVE